MKDNYSAVSESLATLSDRIAIMSHADVAPVDAGAVQARVSINGQQARLQYLRQDSDQTASKSAKTSTIEYRFQRVDTGWELVHLLELDS